MDKVQEFLGNRDVAFAVVLVTLLAAIRFTMDGFDGD